MNSTPTLTPAREAGDHILWKPAEQLIGATNLADYTTWLRNRKDLAFDDYDSLWEWSTSSIGEFWESLLEYFEIGIHTPYESALADSTMPGARWFPGATLNYAERALGHDLDSPAVISVSEGREPQQLGWSELRGQVGAVAEWLRAQGVESGERVVAYAPNTAETLVTFLACASIGAVWSSCSQEYSPQGAADRFAQLEPVVLFAADGYCFGGRRHERRQQAEELLALLPTVTSVLWDGATELPTRAESVAASALSDVVSSPADVTYEHVPFDHPLWVLYSSGTTGRPKGIVHGHGGIILEHLKQLVLHADLSPGKRHFWYSTTSWMVWNVQISGLLNGGTVVLYDGSPQWPEPDALWRLAADLKVDFLGASAAYLTGSQRAGVDLRDYRLDHLSSVGSTGSPLPAECATWVSSSLPSVRLSTSSGGTDIASAFCGGVPTLPVYAAEMTARGLGIALEAWNGEGRPVVDEVGELVVTRPMPSMPLYFWSDPTGERYQDSYFDMFPGVWRHGDWVTVTSRGGVVVHGRSDATMNRYGVRMGSAEIYEVTESHPDVVDSLVVGIELPDGGYWMPLFVRLVEGADRGAETQDQIKRSIRAEVSPRHVPDDVIFVDALPHTLTGKRLEVPVKRILQGVPFDEAANPNSVDDPAALAWFEHLSKRTAGRREQAVTPLEPTESTRQF